MHNLFEMHTSTKMYCVKMQNRPSERTTSSSAIAERPCCRVGQFWPKVEDDILQTV